MPSPRTTPRFAKPQNGTAASRLLCAVPIAFVPVLGGCVDQGPDLSQTAAASTVADYAYSGCSTSVVLGLSRQIADEVGCEHPGGLEAFTETGGMVFTSSSVLAYLESDAKTDLEQVAANHTVQVNSAFRTIAQQYLLVRWHAAGRCGITATAAVGNSNHESGRAVDLANYSSLVGTMSAHGWAHDVAGDPVHFDHLASDDIRGEDTLAFQTLWNANNPGDQIAADGAYGPQTEARLKKSPATGFATGASCVTPAAAATLVSVDGPDNTPPATRAHFSITIENATTADWPATATLVAPADTQLHDTSWIDTTQITALGQDVPAGSMAELSFDVMTPNESTDTPISEQLTLIDGTSTLGTVRVALTVVPDMHTPQSGDGGDTHDFGEVSGGCSTSNGSSFGGLALVLGAVLRRRRRG